MSNEVRIIANKLHRNEYLKEFETEMLLMSKASLCSGVKSLTFNIFISSRHLRNEVLLNVLRLDPSKIFKRPPSKTATSFPNPPPEITKHNDSTVAIIERDSLAYRCANEQRVPK
ncbi:hypothetical protein CDAR_389261 [Caerostris darwini]|uniref:Uncharacterized protein n=1 Tax=Caerostris darwini TaxID=1538125 RepID=A0AAV4PFG6_9ARAC|nr:hypothetical protein CDAR_389261 [Caerostris darwini]